MTHSVATQPKKILCMMLTEKLFIKPGDSSNKKNIWN